MADEQPKQAQGQQVYQLAQMKNTTEDGEEKTTNVLVIITQNGVPSLPQNQQIVVVNPDGQMLNKPNLELLPAMDDESSSEVVDSGDLSLYHHVSVQTAESNDMKKYSRITANKKFKCLICGKELANGSILKRHIRIHTGVRPFQCSLCNKRFTQSNDLTAHMRSHTGSRPFKCEVCGKGFTQRQNVKKHMLTHTGEKNYECTICGKKFGRKHHMEEHMRIHTNSEIRCAICDTGFTANGHLKRHMNKYHPQHTLEQDIQRIVEQEQNEQSIENEMPVVNFVSNQDTVETATVEIASVEPVENTDADPDLSSHIIFEAVEATKSTTRETEESNEILYRCDLCEKQFKDLSLLEKHLRLHLEGKLFSCKVCHKVFNYKGLLKRHSVVHTKLKPYECELCHKRFTQSNDLKIHLRLHTGVKPFKCNHCDQSFNQKQQLKNHCRKHTGERPFACDKCEKRFSRRDHLKAHIKTHNNDHLRCQICGFTSRNEESWKKHSLKHDNVDRLLGGPDFPLSCRYCGKRFKDLSRLEKHEASHESAKNYVCKVCGQTYFRLETFKKHCKLHENVDTDALVKQGLDIDENGEYVGTMIKIEMDHEEDEEEEPPEKSTIIKQDENIETSDEKGDNLPENENSDVSEAEGSEEVNESQKNTMYCCSHCGKMLPWNADLVKHMETHLPGKPGERPTDVTKTGIVQTTPDGRYLCSICGRHFTNLIALQSHIKNIHNMDISDYELNYKESEGIVMTAEEIQMIEKQIQENLRFTGCYSVLKNASKKHLKTFNSYDRNKPIYQCEICAKVVKRKENLDRHRKLHSTVHKCDICNKTFKQRNHLETHRLIKHDSEGGTPIPDTIFVCDAPGCGKTFNKRFNLLRHKALHDRKKNVEGESVNENDEELMIYECRICRQVFKTIDELEDHAINVHPDITEIQEIDGSAPESEEDRNTAEIVSIVTAASEAICDGTKSNAVVVDYAGDMAVPSTSHQDDTGKVITIENDPLQDLCSTSSHSVRIVTSMTSKDIDNGSPQCIYTATSQGVHIISSQDEHSMVSQGVHTTTLPEHEPAVTTENIQVADDFIKSDGQHFTDIAEVSTDTQEISENSTSGLEGEEIVESEGTSKESDLIIQIPPNGDIAGQNVIQCQILNSKTGEIETIFIPVTQDAETEESATGSTITIDTLPMTTEDDNTEVAAAMVELSTDGKYIGDEHAYGHIPQN